MRDHNNDNISMQKNKEITSPKDCVENTYLRLDNLTVGYDKNPLIKHISLGISAGEIWTLMGPNGAGKSTILKTITGQLSSLGGKICVMEKNLSEMAAKEAATHISMLSTMRVQTEYVTCRELVEMGRYPYTGTFGILSEEDHKKAEEALFMVHGTDLAERDFMTLSDGQKQRILLARALCQEPDILILDEPTSYLDLHFKLEILEIIKQLVRTKQVAVLMSLHELELIRKISDHVICVKEGEITEYGPVDQVFTDEKIESLYDLAPGSFHAGLSMAELSKPQGEPKVFVIAGGGAGSALFYELHRKNIPFAVGILHENDLDYAVAKGLATKVLTQKPFERITETQVEEAWEYMKNCDKVYVTVKSFGPGNDAVKELIRRATQEGKIQNG